MTKTFVFGIDGAPPEYIFDEWLDELPNIKKLMKEGSYAKLNSTIPPLSATAWTSITTGKTPADTGIFEYIYRKNYSYNDIHIITTENNKEKTIWQIISENGKTPIICYICLTWPIKPFNGYLINGPLAPSGGNTQYTHPEELKTEIEKNLGEVPPPDISKFREISKEQIIEEVYKLTEKQVDTMKYLIKNKKWDLFFGVVNMSDRLHHMFWRYTDKKHRKYEAGSKFENAIKEFYKFADKKLGELLEELDKDTTIIVLSDHGITRMHNRINLTDWLIQNRYMALKEPIKQKTEFNLSMVDWKKTKAFAIGAYEGQIFINLNGREPEGIVEKQEYEKLIDEIAGKLKKIRGDDGKELNTEIFRKKDYFKGKCENIAPDMIIYFDGLQYGCNTSLIGNETLWSPQTAKGSDDAGHSKQGIFIIKNNKLKKENIGEISYLDVAPTILNELNIKVPEDMKGKIIC
jgi:predicted AlkP superfamily phosphohydrolase/phosphomutase